MIWADWAGQDQVAESYDFTGRRWTFDELAQVLSDISGQTITHREVDEDEGIMIMIGPASSNAGLMILSASWAIPAPASERR